MTTFVRYAVARFEREQTFKAFEIYVSDALKVAEENLCRAFGGSQMSARFAEIIIPEGTAEEMRTEEEIIAHVFKRGWGVKD